MANLSIKGRWHTLTPEWAGNRESDAPFRVKVRRLSVVELDAFKERVGPLNAKSTPTECAEAFAGVVEGPVGALVIDGENVPDLKTLLAFALADGAWVEDGLLIELFRFVIQVNTVAPDQSGN